MELKTVLALFGEILEQGADRACLLGGDGPRSFGQLAERAGGVSRALLKRGVRPGDRVAILASKGLDYLAGMLGAWCCGAAYVPMDPAMPDERLDYIARSSAPACVLCAPSLMDRAGFEGRLSFADVADAGFAVHAAPSGDDLAYIIYTSGSTGRPKGVCISHRALAHFAGWMRDEFGDLAGQPILNIASFSFDQSVLDLVMLFAMGCPMAAFERAPNPFEVLKAVSDYGIRSISSVPTTFNVLFSAPALLKRYDISSLTTLICGGAAFPSALLAKIRGVDRDFDVYNLYGPTEATVYCMFLKVEEGFESERETLPLGVPFKGMDVALVDEDGQEVAGEPPTGELVLIGAQVMSGYYGDEEKTSLSRRVEGPRLEGRPVYRTGDVVTFTGRGHYYFVGRRDDLVKSSGYRISLAEIENNILLMDEVEDAAVVAVPDPNIENRIVGCVVGEASLEAVNEFITRRLPRYMALGSLKSFEALPLNNSGKVDRLQLAQMIKESN